MDDNTHKIITLNNTNKYFLDKQDAAIVSGSVNVYLTCFAQDKQMSSVFLCQCGTGEVIPAYTYKPKNETHANNIYKIFISSAYQNTDAKKTKVEFSNPSNDIRKQFLDKLNTNNFQGSFEEILYETYHFELLKDNRNIYAFQKLNNDTITDIYNDVVKSHNKNTRMHFNAYQQSSELFYAINTLFDYGNIEKQSETLINENDSVDKQINDYATLARVLTRTIKLEPGWEKQDLGPLLCFDKQTHEPIACLPSNSGKSYLYSKNTYKKEKLNSKSAAKLSDKAYVFYRPLPNKSLNFKDVLLFCLKAITLKDILGIIIFGLICSLIGLIVPNFSNLVYGKYIFENDYSSILALGVVVIVSLASAACFCLVRDFISFGATSKMKYALQAGLFGRLFNLSQSYINKHNSADLALRVAGVSSAFSIINTEIINVGLTAIFSIVFLFQMFSYYTLISVVGLFLVLIMAIVLTIIFNKQLKYCYHLIEFDSEKSSLLYGIIKGIAKLRVANAESRGLKKYMDLHIKSTKCTYEISHFTNISSALYASFTLFANIFLFAIIMAGGTPESYSISMGNFVAYMSCFALFSTAILQLPLSLTSISAAIPYVKRMLPILKEVPENESAQKIGSLEKGDIVIDNLSFAYSSEFDNVLSNINLHIHPGEYLGIVGKSGCGKSTLMNLLLGFEKPSSGKIYYDSQDWEFLDKCQMRQKFGVVLQDGDIIPGSIFDNITITKPEATMQEALDAIELVGLKDEILKFPMGVHTFISSDSDTISGGQKQRILIARSIINNPKILFMDEATSALDNATQAHIIDSLAKLKATRVVVAHRLSTVIDCDRIIVIDNGGIAEEGDYKTLMKKCGIFYSLAKRQVA